MNIKTFYDEVNARIFIWQRLCDGCEVSIARAPHSTASDAIIVFYRLADRDSE